MKSHIIGATTSPASTTAVNYNSPTSGGTGSYSTTEPTRAQVVPHAMTLDQLRVKVTVAPGASKSYAFVLMVNGVASALTCTITGASTFTAQDLTHTVSLNAGDAISIRVTPTGTPSAPGVTYWTIRQDATSVFAVLGQNVGSPSSGTNYGPVQNRALASSSAALANIIVPTAGTFSNLYALFRTAPTAGSSMDFTLFKNGVATTLTTNIANTAVANNDVAHSVSVSAGDLVAIQLIANGTPTSTTISWGLTFTPTTDGESFVAYSGNGANIPTSATNYNNIVGADASWSTTESGRLTMFAATTVKAMYNETSVSPGVSPKAYAFTLRQNAADTAATATVNDASTAVGSTRRNQITGLSVAIADDDTMAIKSVPTGTPIAAFGKTSFLTFISPGGALTLLTLDATAVGSPTLARQLAANRTLSASGTGAPTMSNMISRVKTLSATAVGSPSISMLRNFFRTLAATAVGSPVIARTVSMFRTLSATATGSPTLAKVKSAYVILSATGTGVPTITRIKTAYRTLSATGSGVPSISMQKSFTRTLNASAVGVVTMTILRNFYRVLSASAVGVATMTKAFVYTKAMSAAAVGSATLTKIKTSYRTMSAAAVGSPSITRLANYYRTLSATAVGSATITMFRNFYRILSAAATGVASLSKGFSYTKTLNATATGTPSMTKSFVYGKVLNATATGVATITRIVGRFRTLSATAVGSVSISRLANYYRTLSATATGSPTLARAKNYYRTLSATAIGTPTLTRLKSFKRTLNATAIGNATLARKLTRGMVLTAVAVGIGSIDIIRSLSIVMTAVAVGIPTLIGQIVGQVVTRHVVLVVKMVRRNHVQVVLPAVNRVRFTMHEINNRVRVIMAIAARILVVMHDEPVRTNKVDVTMQGEPIDDSNS